MPVRAAVDADLAPVGRLFQNAKGRLDPAVERFPLDGARLLLRVVEGISVYCPHAEVLSAFRQAVTEESRRQAMAAPNQLLAEDNLFFEKLALHILAVFLSRRWWSTIERNVPGLRADDDLVSLDDPGFDVAPDRGTDASFRSLRPIVESGIADIDPRSNCVLDCRRVRCVILIGSVA